MASVKAPSPSHVPQTDASPPSPADSSILPTQPLAFSDVTATVLDFEADFSCGESGFVSPRSDSESDPRELTPTLPQIVAAYSAAVAADGDAGDAAAHDDSNDVNGDSTHSSSEHAAVAAQPIYDQLVAHLQNVHPPIIGIRFELLLDGSPDHLGGACESQLHVVVVRKVSWKNVKYSSWIRLGFMLLVMWFMLCVLFGPITGSVLLYLLNDQRLASEFAINLPHSGDSETMSRNAAAAVASVACGRLLLCAAMNMLNSAMNVFGGQVTMMIVWMLEKIYGLTLISLAFSCVSKSDRQNSGAAETRDSSFTKQYNRARSTLCVLAFQHIILMQVHLNIDDDTALIFLLKLLFIVCCTVEVMQCPDKVYFFCSEWFCIPGLPQFQPPLLFIVNTDNVTRVLKLRNNIRIRSMKELRDDKIEHVQREHIDSVCVGHVTTERLLSGLVPPTIYNSPACRKILYYSYTYILPVVNFMFLVLFPSDSVAKLLSWARASISNDFILVVLQSARFMLEKVFAVVGWAVEAVFADLHDLISKMAEWFGAIFNFLASGFESVSAHISAFDQRISYIASRLVTLKKVFELVFQSMQAVCVSVYKLVSAFTTLLPYISKARTVSGTAAGVDTVGRWLHSGWMRNLWRRWCRRRKRPHND